MDSNVTRRCAMQFAAGAAALPATQFELPFLENGHMPFTPKFADLVRNFTTSTGTGPVVLGTAVTGYTSIIDALSTGDQFYYCIQGVDKPQEREVGRGTLMTGGKVGREAIAGGLTNFTTGTKTVALVTAAEWFARLDQAGSGASIEAASLAALAAAPTSRGPAMLTEKGREGLFVFNAADMSAKVAADPCQGICVPPSANASGAAGAWVRNDTGGVNVRWFGAKGNGTTDDSAAFVAAIAYLKSIAGNLSQNGIYKASQELFVPAGHYFLGTTTLDVTHTFRLRGDGSGFQGPSSATLLRWAAGATGIRIQAHNTSGASSVDGSWHFGAQGFEICGLELRGGYATAESGDFHGIHAKARFSLHDVVIGSFEGDGLHISATSLAGDGSEGNANLFRVQNAAMLGCRNGAYVRGADANAGSFINVDFSGNRQWGVDEGSFLGNTYIGCHSSGNAGGAYRTISNNGQNVFVGCYSEGDQPTSQFVYPTMVLGGLHAAGAAGTGAYLRSTSDGLRIEKIMAGDGTTTFGFSNLGIAFANATALPLGASLRFNNRNHVAWGYANSDQYELEAFEITTPGTLASMDPHYMWFPRGFYFGDAGNAKKMLSGTAAPTTGAWNRGDMVWNSAPSAGGVPGWMCTSGGSPGTWTAMANLAA